MIAPQAVNKFGWMKGSMQVPCGTVSVAYKKTDGKVHFTVEIPEGVEAVLSYDGGLYPMHAGENTVVV